MSADPGLPVVVFGFNRPHHFRRVLNALSRQDIERLLIFIDGPRSQADRSGVEACRALARQVDWAPKELVFSDDNHGLAGLEQNIHLVFERFPRAVFVADDCLPMPGFYAFMRLALEHYANQKQVFSIGGYQPLPPGLFDSKNQAVAAGPRFTCWGWACWRDRWEALRPDLQRYITLFDNLSHIPDIAGSDLPAMARRMAVGDIPASWDIKVAIACLHQRKIHLLASRGLVRNIGLDQSGINGSLSAVVRDLFFQNRNLNRQLPVSLDWPQVVDLDCEYAAAYRHYIFRMRNASIRRWWMRLKTLARRYLLPGGERFEDLDLLETAHLPLVKRALLSYLVYPFTIPRDDPRFIRHINIWHAIEFVRTLNQMGYRVDAMDYRDQDFSPTRSYDVFIGHAGINFEKIAARLPANTRKIYSCHRQLLEISQSSRAGSFCRSEEQASG